MKESKLETIMCDNPKCDYTTETSDIQSYINKPCPKCGENLLTEDDYERSVKIREILDEVNNIDQEDVVKANKQLNDLVTKYSNDQDGLNLINSILEASLDAVIHDEPNIDLSIESHKKLTVTSNKDRNTKK